MLFKRVKVMKHGAHQKSCPRLGDMGRQMTKGDMEPGLDDSE